MCAMKAYDPFISAGDRNKYFKGILSVITRLGEEEGAGGSSKNCITDVG